MSGLINDPKVNPNSADNAKLLAMIFATYSTLDDKRYCLLDFSRCIGPIFITAREISRYLMKIYWSGWNSNGRFLRILTFSPRSQKTTAAWKRNPSQVCVRCQVYTLFQECMWTVISVSVYSHSPLFEAIINNKAVDRLNSENVLNTSNMDFERFGPLLISCLYSQSRWTRWNKRQGRLH